MGFSGYTNALKEIGFTIQSVLWRFRKVCYTTEFQYTIFEFNNQRVRFITSDKLERYTKVVEWDNGYLVVMAKYKEMPEVEEYIDLIPILNMLYYDTETFLKSIKEVKIYAA